MKKWPEIFYFELFPFDFFKKKNLSGSIDYSKWQVVVDSTIYNLLLYQQV